MSYLLHFIDIFLHIDKYLGSIIADYGTLTYLILFVVIFCETGLVVTPFLPGDSLLFASGAFSATGSLDLHMVALVILIAAVLGDAVNYAIGNYLGTRVYEFPDGRFYKRRYLDRTHQFYEKYGGKTIIIARFVPIVRTFAPFLAGVGKMTYAKFALYNITGAVLWVLLFVYGGYLFSGLSFVKNNFSLVIMVIVFISILPPVIEAIRIKRQAQS